MTYTYTCMVIDDDQTQLALIKEAAVQLPGVRVPHVCTSLAQALAVLQTAEKKLDIIFCDIKLLDANGLDHGPMLANHCKLLIYVTSHVHLKGKVLDALGDDCLIKPVTSTDIQLRVLGRFIKRYGEEMPVYIRFNKLFMYDGTAKVTRHVKIKHVRVIKHQANYLDIYAGKTVPVNYIVRSTIALAMALLEPAGIFIQINPSTIVNANFIDDFSATEVVINEVRYKVTAAYREDFKAFVNEHGLGRRSL